MDEKVVAELNKNIEDKTAEISSLQATIAETNEALVNANKLMEEANANTKALEDELNTCKTELNTFKEKEALAETEKVKAEVNAYFENEISKNGFEEAEVNSLQEFVEKCDLDGLKKAEAELCAKKFKELLQKGDANVETNAKKDDFSMFIAIPEKKKKTVAEEKVSFFN